jgi:hypothetical protein
MSTRIDAGFLSCVTVPILTKRRARKWLSDGQALTLTRLPTPEPSLSPPLSPPVTGVVETGFFCVTLVPGFVAEVACVVGRDEVADEIGAIPI